MYERFSDSSRKVMMLTNREARRFNHEYIGTEHILLAMCTDEFQCCFGDIAVGVIKAEVEALMQPGPMMLTIGKVPMTPRARRVLELALSASNDGLIEPAHLVAGLVAESGGVASIVLGCLGMAGPVWEKRSEHQLRVELPQPANIMSRLAELERRLSHIEKVLG